jgi:hypothetical protein
MGDLNPLHLFEKDPVDPVQKFRKQDLLLRKYPFQQSGVGGGFTL